MTAHTRPLPSMAMARGVTLPVTSTGIPTGLERSVRSAKTWTQSLLLLRPKKARSVSSTTQARTTWVLALDDSAVRSGLRLRASLPVPTQASSGPGPTHTARMSVSPPGAWVVTGAPTWISTRSVPSFWHWSRTSRRTSWRPGSRVTLAPLPAGPTETVAPAAIWPSRVLRYHSSLAGWPG